MANNDRFAAAPVDPGHPNDGSEVKAVVGVVVVVEVRGFRGG